MTPHGMKVRAGQDRARRDRGARIGRPTNPALTADVLRRAREMRAAGASFGEIVAALHVPRTTLHRALHRDDATDVVAGEHGDE